MSKIFLISDTHFGHDGIMRYENRPFSNVQEMDETIVRNWNSVVSKNDTVIVPGDVSFYSKEKTKAIIKSLKGKKILILGNHDNDHTVDWWEEVGFNSVSEYPIIIEKFFLVSHEPLYINSNMPYANIHGHIHNQSYESKQYFNVSVEKINYTPILLETVIKQITSK